MRKVDIKEIKLFWQLFPALAKEKYVRTSAIDKNSKYLLSLLGDNLHIDPVCGCLNINGRFVESIHEEIFHETYSVDFYELDYEEEYIDIKENYRIRRP